MGYAALYFNFNAMPKSLIVIVGTFLAYSIFTIIHEASHGNIARGNASFEKLETIIGWISGMALFFPYKAFVTIHLQHHAHTNDSEQDPDGYVRGSNLLEVFFRCLTLVGHYYVSSLGANSNTNEAMKRTKNQTWLFIILNIAIVTLFIYNNQFTFFLYVFLLPALIAAPILGFTFDWLPHYPHHNLGKYHNTRIVTIPGLEFLSFFQSYHLIHHLYPRVPFYNYKKRYQMIQKELIEASSPIEGFKKGNKSLFDKTNTYSDVLNGLTWSYSLEVEEIKQQTHDAVSIQFKNLENIPFQYKAGQYVVLSMLVNGVKVSRCYSISSNPNKGKLIVGVKRVKGGKLSNIIIDKLSKGARVNVAGPYGSFQFVNDESIKTNVFIAGGSGITPILSMIEKVLEDNLSKVVLIYGCRSSKDVMFNEQLQLLKKQYSDTFGLIITYDILTKENQVSLLKNHTEVSNYFLCGPKLMMNASVQALNSLGITNEKIFKEDFSLESEKLAGEKYMVNFLGNDFEIYESETILEGAIRNKVSIPYACNQGQCGTCKLKLEEGKINWKTQEQTVLLDNEKQASYILTCMCMPNSNIKIK